jgi:hypothetical protein
MFNNKSMSVGDWWLFWILMLIPFVNIFFFFVVLLSSKVNKSLKNYVIAMILPLVIIIGLLFGLGLFSNLLQLF